MVRLTRIYTRGGDNGQTSLGDGSRVPKQSLRVEAYGTVDEANAAIGLARLYVGSGVDADAEADAMLARIQNDLFDLGADLCTPEDGRRAARDQKRGALRIIAAQVARLEHEIDAMNAAMRPLDSFILPGGTAAAAHLHLARTVTRRAERLVCALAAAEAVNSEVVNPEAVKYLNRLSDHLFVLGRRVNDNGARDVLWQPGATR
jgi:cob(I)alamin adenosyltransferase